MVGDLIDLFEFVTGGVEADLESFDFTEPSLLTGFGDAGDEVVADVDEAVPFGRVGPQEGTAQAGVFVDAGSGVGTAASAEGEFAVLEMTEELVPLLLGGHPVFLGRAQRTPSGDERAVPIDDFLGIDGLVSHGGVDVAVAGDELGDVRGHAVQHSVGDEHAAKVVRGELERSPGGIGDAGIPQSHSEPVGDGAAGDGALFQAESTLEQQRYRRVPDPFMGVIGGDTAD